MSLDRREVVATILANRGAALVVSGLGSPTWDVAAAGDDDLNFYLWGAMGSAIMVGLGLALTQPVRPVLVITGDGEVLMGLGSLATAGTKRPPNLSVVVIDNERYGETGMQRSHTALGVDLPAIAAAAGFDWTTTVRDAAGLSDLGPRLFAGTGCGLAAVKVAAVDLPRVLPTHDGVRMQQRFRHALLDDGG